MMYLLYHLTKKKKKRLTDYHKVWSLSMLFF